jgi:uncharacterized membrane protein
VWVIGIDIEGKVVGAPDVHAYSIAMNELYNDDVMRIVSVMNLQGVLVELMSQPTIIRGYGEREPE